MYTPKLDLETLSKTAIDPSLPIAFCVEFDDGTRWFEQNNEPKGKRSEWLEIKDLVHSGAARIRKVWLFNTSNSDKETIFDGACTEVENADGYFFAHKMVATPGGPTVSGHGIGWLKKDGLITVVWYNDGMGCISREERHPNTCEVTLIRNPPLNGKFE
jgi:hypothetical protein